MTARVLERCAGDVAFMEDKYKAGHVAALRRVAEKPFARVTYTDAISILLRAQRSEGVEFKYPVAWGESLQSEHERYLAEVHFQGPVFVTNYPAGTKPFYMREDDVAADVAADVPVTTASRGTVACVDLLVPGIGELCGGSQREERAPVLLRRMAAAGLNPETYRWYAELRVFGSVPHSGWGMGFERFVAFVSGMDNVRDTTLVPRAPGLLAI